MKTREAVMLKRGRRYRHKGITYYRNVPKIVDEETEEYLVEDTGFFRKVRLDARGRAIMPKPKVRRRRGRSRIHGDTIPALADTGDEPNTGGAEEV
jgi:hypothetical protein